MSAASVRTSGRRDNFPVLPKAAGSKGEPGSFSKPLALRYWFRSSCGLWWTGSSFSLPPFCLKRSMALDKVWVTSFNGKIGVMDFNGNPIGKESDFPTAGKNGGLQGVGIAPNGDVWIADAVKDQLLYFPADA